MAPQATNREKQATNREDSCASLLTSPADVVQEYPISTAMLVFGVGLGVGILASHALFDSWSHLVQPPPTMRERLTRQLYDAFSQAVPESVARRFAA